MAKIGEILLRKKWITQEQLDQALRQGGSSGELVGKTLLKLGFLTEEQFLEALAEQMGLQYFASLQSLTIDPALIKAVSPKFVWHYKFMPLRLENDLLTIAVSDPLAVWAAEDLKLHLGYDIRRVLASQEEIMAAIRRYYGMAAETVEEILTQKGSQPEARHEEAAEVDEGSSDQVSVIKLVNQIMTEAVNARATDIHIEFYKDSMRVRYRIDGVLYEMLMPDRAKMLHQAIVSRIKILSGLNVVERRVPQDGRAVIKIQDRRIDLRVSIIPSLCGENVVIRILPVHLLHQLEDLGFDPVDLKIMLDLTEKPHGIVFLTGPTGSGKTTSLYACLTKLNREGIKIITIEDPVEYELKGVMQIQVRPEVGFTFANALRSVLRHDPDVMMVGEVRDLETAELAIRTSLTGHLIFSTLHTNDACSAAPRLIDIGIEPYLVASSVLAFISQRLVRVICPDCKIPRRQKDLLPPALRDAQVFEGAGCDRCKGTGYRGRMAIYELLAVDETIRQLILAKAPGSQIEQAARRSGFRTLRESGYEKVRKGLTTPEEVGRVIGAED